MPNKYRYFDIIQFGPLFDPETEGEIGVDIEETHRNRDAVLIATLRQWGEILENGLAEPRDAGKLLKELSDEAEAIEQEIGFGYE